MDLSKREDWNLSKEKFGKKWTEKGYGWMTPQVIPSSVDTIVSHAVKLLEGRKDVRVADLGCGANPVGKHLVSEPHYIADRVTYVDFCDIDILDNKLENVVTGDFDKFLKEHNDEEFDLILMINSLNDSFNPAHTLARAYESLVDGGHVLMTVPGEGAERIFPNQYSDAKPFPYVEFTHANSSIGSFMNKEWGFKWRQYSFPESNLRSAVGAFYQITRLPDLMGDASAILPICDDLLLPEDSFKLKPVAERFVNAQKDPNYRGPPTVAFYDLKKN